MIGPYQNQTITWIRRGTPGDWLEPGEDEELDLKARVNWKNALVRNPEGEMVSSSVNILIDVPRGEIIFFNDGFKIEEREYSIIQVDRKEDFSSRYYQIWLK